MLLLTVLLLFYAVLNQSLIQVKNEEEEEEGENEEDEEDLTKGSGVSLELQREIVDKHNEIRRNVEPTASNMLKMIWNETVGESARKWAEQCVPRSSPLELRTFDDVLCGQTIYRSNFISSWTEVVDYWDTKKDNFQYGVGPVDPSKSIYSYTQAIWYNSYILGCAVSYCPDSQYPFMHICQYCPAGNIAGQIGTPYKEGPPCGNCPKHCEDKLCTNPCKYVDRIRDCDKLKVLTGCRKANKHGLCNATCKCKNKII